MAQTSNSDLSIFTPKQREKLLQAGFESLYSIVVYFPYRYESVEPLEENTNLQENVTYFIQGTVLSLQRRKNYYIFSIQSANGGRLIQAYYFARGRFIETQFRPGSIVQVEIFMRKGFVTVSRIAPLRPPSKENLTDKSPSLQPLGSKSASSYIKPIYHKVNTLSTIEWYRIHRRIPQQVYVLDCHNLIPENSRLLPTEINLFDVHKPDDISKTKESIKQYEMLSIFLRLSYQSFIRHQNRQLYGRASVPDQKFLTQLSGVLPFSLSLSQKQVIWSLIQGFSSQ